MEAERIKRYVWLIQTLLRAGDNGLSFNAIQQKLKATTGEAYPRRTFNNHREVIGELFGIDIECRMHGKDSCYYIPLGDSAINDSNKMLIDLFSVNNALSAGKNRLKGRISVENIPSGQIYLAELMDLMSDNRIINLSYRKYDSEETATYRFRPYAVKEYAKRWYTVGFCEEKYSSAGVETTGGMRIFALDRITEIELTDDVFTLATDFDVDLLFLNSFGIYLTDGKAETIRFRVTPKEAKYIRDLPIHHSQTFVGKDEKGMELYEIHVCIDKNVIMEFLKYGADIEIISPDSFRLSIAQTINRMNELYAGTGRAADIDKN